MKAFSIKALFLLAFIAGSAVEGAAAVGTYAADSLNCANLGNAKRYIGVYLPPNYSADSTYPSVYFLHGAGGTVTPAANFILDCKPLFDTLISQNKIPKMIIIAVDGHTHLSSPGFVAGWYANSTLYGNIENYIINDVIPYVDGKYKTKNSRSFRGIMGHSMGGYGALKLGMKHSDIFGGIASHSGLTAFDKFLADVSHDKKNAYGEPDSVVSWGQNLDFAMSGAFSPNLAAADSINHIFDGSFNVVPGVRTAWLQHDDYTLLDTYQTQLKTMSVYVDCGAVDELNFDSQARLIDQKMTSLGITHTFRIYPSFGSYPADHCQPYDRGFYAWNDRRVKLPLLLDSNYVAFGLKHLGAFFTSASPAIRYHGTAGNGPLGIQMSGSRLLELDLAQAGDVLVRATDPLGRTVYVYRAQNQPKGGLNLRMPQGLSSQRYILSVSQNGNQVARKVILQ